MSSSFFPFDQPCPFFERYPHRGDVSMQRKKDTIPMVVANWKMNGSSMYLTELCQTLREENCDIPWILCPPAPFLGLFTLFQRETPSILLGAQDCSPNQNGAYTGDVSPELLHLVGARYVIIGHSERRAHHAETNQLVAKKAQQAQKYSLYPIICIGESLDVYESGETMSVLAQQLKESTEGVQAPYIIAYEPIWAIGTGKTPTPEQIAAVHSTLRNLRPDCCLLYGGSVTEANCESILKTPNVDGVLVGGASLKAASFSRILQIAEDMAYSDSDD